MLSLLIVVRTDNQEGGRNDVLTDAGAIFSDIDLCMWLSTALLLAYPFDCPPHSDKVDIKLLLGGGVAAVCTVAPASLYKVEFRGKIKCL